MSLWRIRGGGVSRQYILDGHLAKPVDLLIWVRWLETANRVVSHTTVGGAEVSTVFIGLGRVMFATLVFGGGPLDQETVRYDTWEQAEQGHAAMVVRVREAVVA